jgi:photosystem II stability/assembly factor-like uncharacterized protein
MKTPRALLSFMIVSGVLVLAASAAVAAVSAVTPSSPPHLTSSLAAPDPHLQAVTPRLQAATFTNPKRGYGLFGLFGAKCQVAVGATTDGGGRFTRPVVAETWPCNGNAPVSSLTSDSSGDVFVFGPALVVSHDHGASWADVKTGGDVLSVSAVGRSVWLLTARCPGRGTSPDRCPVRLLVSANGGRTWRLGHLHGATAGGFGSQVISQAQLVRKNKTTAYVLTSPVVNPRGKSDNAQIWITDDGGGSWSRHSVACGIDALTAVMAVAPSGQIFVACADEPGVGMQDKSLASSDNGGRTWALHNPCAHRMGFCPPIGDGYLGQIAATSAATVFLVGPRSALLVTHNAGRSWHVVTPEIGGESGGTTYIAFFKAHGVVLGDDQNDNETPAIWHTSDGGAHWSETYPVVG